jgi:hypothetical protein
MTDQQIEDAYRRLDGALAPPADVAVRVERQIRGRRARRRTAMAGVAGLVVVGAVGGAVLLGSGDDQSGDRIATDQSVPGPQGSFVLTRPDGSTYEFTDLTLSCDRDARGEDLPPGTMTLYSPFEPDESGEALARPFLQFEAIVDKVDGREFQLPFERDNGSSNHRAFTLFAADVAPSGKTQGNEVSSAEAGAAGTLHVIRASCDPTPVLELEADATLGSEVNQAPYDVTGSFG